MIDDANFKNQYTDSKTWQQKIIIISLYHSTMLIQNNGWKVKNTADYFGVSVGLISENIRLAELGNEQLMKCKTREDGLRLIERRKYPRNRTQPPLIKEQK